MANSRIPGGLGRASLGSATGNSNSTNKKGIYGYYVQHSIARIIKRRVFLQWLTSSYRCDELTASTKSAKPPDVRFGYVCQIPDWSLSHLTIMGQDGTNNLCGQESRA